MKRLTFVKSSVAASLGGALLPSPLRSEKKKFRLRYILSSAMYGTFKVTDILPEVAKCGASAIDLWPRPHGNQREQVREMGNEAFKAMLDKNKVSLGVSTCYKLGPFDLQEEMHWAKTLTGKSVTLVCGGKGNKNAKGEDLKVEVRKFVEEMKPHHESAEKTDCTIAIENHANNVISSPDSLKYFTELSSEMPGLTLAFAPHHLPQDGKMQGDLIRQLGKESISFFYAQQFGTGSHHKQPREKEILQMPGRGPLDFKPIIQALKAISFDGFTEVFMHPFPRGLPIRDTVEEITREINRSRDYLDNCI